MSDTVRTDCMCHSENSQTVDRMLNAGARARSMPGGDSHLNLLSSYRAGISQSSNTDFQKLLTAVLGIKDD